MEINAVKKPDGLRRNDIKSAYEPAAAFIGEAEAL
jgi:hypothetical protein